MTVSITTFCIKCRYAECRDLFIVKWNVVAPKNKQERMTITSIFFASKGMIAYTNTEQKILNYVGYNPPAPPAKTRLGWLGMVSIPQNCFGVNLLALFVSMTISLLYTIFSIVLTWSNLQEFGKITPKLCRIWAQLALFKLSSYLKWHHNNIQH
jgi:hypothetical protein